MMKRIADPLVLGPIGFTIYFWYAFGWSDGPLAFKALLVLVTILGLGFSVSSWLDSDPDEETRERSKKVAHCVFMAGFGAFGVGILSLLGYLFFVTLPNSDVHPLMRWGLQGFFVVFVGFLVWELVVRYLQFRKGSIKILKQREEYLFGDKILGAVQLNLKRDVEIQQVTATLIGCTRHQRRTHGGGSYMEEEVFYQEELNLPFAAGTHHGEQNFAEFNFSTDKPEILTLLQSDKDLHWYIKVTMRCVGVDLDAQQGLDIYLPDDDEFDELVEKGALSEEN